LQKNCWAAVAGCLSSTSKPIVINPVAKAVVQPCRFFKPIFIIFCFLLIMATAMEKVLDELVDFP
jgi:hypothetical protein